MPETESQAGEPFAAVVAFGLLFAASRFALALVGLPVVDRASPGAYVAGAVLAFAGSAAVGMIAGLLLSRAPRSRFALGWSLAFAGMPLALDALAAAPPAASGGTMTRPALLVLVCVVGVATLLPRLARALAGRLATRTGRLADAVPFALLAVVSVGTLAVAEGDLAAGLRFGWVDRVVPRPAPPPPPEPPELPRGPTGEVVPPDEVVAMYQVMQGVERPWPAADPLFPLCRGESTDRTAEMPDAGPLPPPHAPRSVLLVLLEGVGEREVALERDGRPVLPTLRALFAEGARVAPFYAARGDSAASLDAIFGGVPPSPGGSRLVHEPIPQLDAFPRRLRAAGHRTIFVAGEDLSRGGQRHYLERAGFDDVVEPDPIAGEPMRASDAVGVARFRAAIDRARAEAPDRPLFATLRTDGTRRPYLGEDGTPGSASDFESMVAALGRLDAALADLHRWYVEHERPRGTLLVVVGASAPPVSYPGDPLLDEPLRARFEVPFVVVGLEENELGLFRSFRGREGGHVDLAQTILPLAGIRQRGCFQGRDLFAAEPYVEWPVRRVIVSAAEGALYFHDHVRAHHAHDVVHHRHADVPEGRVRWTVVRDRIYVHDLDGDPLLRRDLFATDDPSLTQLHEFRLTFARLDEYLLVRGRYAPKGAEPAAPPVPAGEAPLRFGDAGGFEPPRGGAPVPQTDAAIDVSLRAIPEGVALLVHLTSDGVAVVGPAPSADLRPFRLDVLRRRRAPYVALADALRRVGPRVRTALVLVRPPIAGEDVRLARLVAREIAAMPPADRPIVVASSRDMAATLRTFSGATVVRATATGDRLDSVLADASDQRLPWVAVPAGPSLRAFVPLAHRVGVRVLAFAGEDAPDVGAFPADGWILPAAR